MKSILTALITIASIFFYINGPLNLEPIELTSAHSDQAFFKAQLIGSEKKEKTSFKLLASIPKSKEGSYALVDGSKKRPLGFGFISQPEKNNRASKSIRFETRLKQQLGKTDKLVEITQSNSLTFAEINKEGKQLFYVENEGFTNHIKGFSGPVQLGIFIESGGSLERVNLLSSNETESYLRDMHAKGFYEPFKLISIDYSEQYVDAVSGATLTSRAVASSLSYFLKSIDEGWIQKHLSKERHSEFKLRARLSNWWIIDLILLCFAFVYAIQNKWKKSKQKNRYLFLFSLGYFGFFLNASFTYSSFFHLFQGKAISVFLGVYCLFILYSTILQSNVYCKYICPFGNVQRLLIKYVPVKHIPFFLSNRNISRVRSIITLGLLALFFAGFNSLGYELFPDLFSVQIGNRWFWITLILLTISLKYPLIWCRLLCPTGEILDRLKQFAHLKWPKRSIQFKGLQKPLFRKRAKVIDTLSANKM